MNKHFLSLLTENIQDNKGAYIYIYNISNLLTSSPPRTANLGREVEWHYMNRRSNFLLMVTWTELYPFATRAWNFDPESKNVKWAYLPMPLTFSLHPPSHNNQSSLHPASLLSLAAVTEMGDVVNSDSSWRGRRLEVQLCMSYEFQVWMSWGSVGSCSGLTFQPWNLGSNPHFMKQF